MLSVLSTLWVPGYPYEYPAYHPFLLIDLDIEAMRSSCANTWKGFGLTTSKLSPVASKYLTRSCSKRDSGWLPVRRGKLCS